MFFLKFTADCMTHSCRIVRKPKKVRLDVCCRYGVDVDVAERDAILARRDELKEILDDEVAEMDWFYDEEHEDEGFPSGRYVRTAVHGKGCIFLSHDARGCAIHRTALVNGWDFRGTKPHVCRLFPLTYEDDAIVISDDYSYYSCSRDMEAPSLYRVFRDDLGDIFGADLIAALDEAELKVFDRLTGKITKKSDKKKNHKARKKLPVMNVWP